MNNNFLVKAPSHEDPTASQDHPDESDSQLRVKRRTFIKRTGAATVATMLAWNATVTSAKAETTNTGGSSYRETCIYPKMNGYGQSSSSSVATNQIFHEDIFTDTNGTVYTLVVYLSSTKSRNTAEDQIVIGGSFAAVAEILSKSSSSGTTYTTEASKGTTDFTYTATVNTVTGNISLSKTDMTTQASQSSKIRYNVTSCETTPDPGTSSGSFTMKANLDFWVVGSLGTGSFTENNSKKSGIVACNSVQSHKVGNAPQGLDDPPN